MIFFWFHAISTDDVLFTPLPARALWRALCVHCQNTRTRPAPPSCSEPWCCAVLAAAVCLLVSLCARSWNTIVSLKGPCSISRYLQIFWEYCWWKKSCTAAGMFDNTVWLLPPHPLFNVVFSSLVRRCRISVIQLLCFCDNFFLPMLNGEHEGQESKCVWWCRIFSINRMDGFINTSIGGSLRMQSAVETSWNIFNTARFAATCSRYRKSRSYAIWGILDFVIQLRICPGL